MKKILMIACSKGGVGKSMVANACIDALIESGIDVLMIDSDTSNPDVFKSYEKVIHAETVDLDRKEGWMELLNIFNRNPQSTFVVNTAARNNGGIAAFSNLLLTGLPELNKELVTLWVINRQRDSVELLREYREHVNVGQLHVVRNTHFGDPEKFELFNNSRIKKEIQDSGGLIIDFPDLADRVADIVSNKRLAIGHAAQELDFGERIELMRWRSEVALTMKPLMA